MRYFIILLALVALGVCAPNVKQRAADQDLLNKQQDVIQLLQKISQPIPNQELQNLGVSYDIENNSHQYKNPIIVKYYAGAVKAGLVQPQGTTFSNSISQLRKEVSLLYRILLGAKDYQTFLKTAAWARVHVNEGQFVKALVGAVLTRPDTQGVIFPPVYEILPQHHLDSRIIQEAQNIAIQNTQEKGNRQNILIPVNYSALLSNDEQQLSYFTQDVGLAAYYAQVNLAGYIQEQDQQQQQPLTQQQYQQQIVGKYLQQQAGQQDQQANIGRGAQYLYLHQQLLARYELNRLSNGLGPIEDVDYENVQSLYQPHLRGLNGLEFAGRPKNLQLQPQRNQLIQHVATLEKRLRDAIDSGNVITPQGVFLSLYQPQGMNILGDLIEGTGRSVNPRYYGSLQAAARKLLGNAPEVQNIWDYTPSSLELGEAAVHDPVFYQLYKKVMNLYQQYQQSLPAYQYNDLILPGVTIQNVDVSQLVTLFTDYYVDLDAVTGQQSQQQHEQEQTQSHVRAHLKRLDHQPYQYRITVHSEQNVPSAVVRVFLGPKHDHQGQPIDISKNQHLFVELDQFIQNLHAGENTIVRNSQQAPGQSSDWPSTSQIQQGVNAAVRSQEPFYVTEPHQIFSFPARLSLPKGQQQGFPLQFLVVISSPNPLNVPYGPVVPEQSLTYQNQQYQVVSVEQYEQLKQQAQISQMGGGIQQNVEVLPENLANAQQQVQAVRNYYANLYTKYHGQYPNTQIQNPVGQGQDMTYSIQGVVVGNAGGWLGQQGNWNQQQVQQAQQVQQQMQAATAAAQQSQQQRHQHAAQMIYGHQQSHHGQHINSSPFGQSVQSAQQQQQQQQQQSGLQGLQSVQGVQGVVQAAHNMQGVQGVQGVLQQVFGQGVQGMNVPYGMQRVQSGGQTWPNSQVQGAVWASGMVASGQQHAGGWQNIYAQPQTVQDQTVSEYYQNKPISEIIGGAISLDGKPLGFPLDRPLSLGALSVPNIFVKDVLVFHQGQPTNDITQ